MSIESLRKVLSQMEAILGDFKAPFKISFIDEKDFREFIGHLRDPRAQYWKGIFTEIHGKKDYWIKHIYISGFVSDFIDDLITFVNNQKCDVRIITRYKRPEHQRLFDNGIQMRFNKDYHFRMFLGLTNRDDLSNSFVILGTFDFDKQALASGRRRDTGIITNHPSIVRKSFDYFEKVWNDKYQSRDYSEIG